MLIRRDASCGCQDCSFDGNEALLTGSVSLGKGLASDIEITQILLNQIAPVQGGPALKLAIDGIFGPKTDAAVKTFQTKWLGWSDGRIDPGGLSLNKLKSLVTDSPAAKSGTIGKTGQGKKKPPAGPSLADLQVVDIYIDAAKEAVAAVREKIGNLRWKISRRDPTTMALMRKHFVNSNEKLDENDIIQVQSIIAGVHHHMARSNAFGRYNYENHIVFDFDEDPGTVLGWTSYGGDKLSINQNQIYYSKTKKKLIKAPGSTIFITRLFLDPPNIERSWVMLHEYCHLVGPDSDSPKKIADNGYAFEGNFVTMSKFMKLHNAESLSFFMTEFCFGTKVAAALPRIAAYADWFNSAPIVAPNGEKTN